MPNCDIAISFEIVQHRHNPEAQLYACVGNPNATEYHLRDKGKVLLASGDNDALKEIVGMIEKQGR